MCNKIGKKVWIIPDCELPPEGEGVAKGHESVIIVNDSDTDAEIAVNGKTLTLSVPRTALGVLPPLCFEFKWSDNMQQPDVMDFYVNGDTAPIGRFNYLYREY